MKNYTFSNLASEDSYNSRDKIPLYHYQPRYPDHKTIDTNQQRIQEIKKKYDTPNRRERIDSLKNSKDFELKQNFGQNKFAANQGSANSNYLKQSYAANRMDKSFLKGEVDSKQFVTLRGNQNQREAIRSNIQQRGPRRTGDSRDSEYRNRLAQRQDQEVFFNKMRQMKESILNDGMKGSINGTGKQSNNGRSSFGERNQRDRTSNSFQEYLGKKDQSDPRVQNIDKINSKIKQILSCLAENQMKPSKYIKSDNTSVGASSLKRSDIANSSNRESAFFGSRAQREFRETEGSDNRKTFDHSHTNSQLLQKISIRDFKDLSGKKKHQQPIGSSVLRDHLSKKLSTNERQSLYDNSKERFSNELNSYSVNKVDKRVNTCKDEKEESWKRSYVQKGKREENTVKVSRSKSYLSSIKKSDIGGLESHQLHNGKKLNDEISRIQKKIEEFQEEKKKLNIQFTPFSSKSTSNLRALTKFDRTQENSKHQTDNDCHYNGNSAYQAKESKPQDSDYSFERRRDQIRRDITVGLGQDYRKTTQIQKSKQPQRLSMDFQLKIQQVSELNTVRLENQSEVSEQHSINGNSNFTSNNYSRQESQQPSLTNNTPQNQQASLFDEMGLRKRTGDGIEQRKKRLREIEMNSCSPHKYIKLLVGFLCDQVKIDQNLRNMKIWFDSCYDTDKYYKISKNLQQKYHLSLSPEACETQFSLHDSENNPFFTLQDFDGSYDLLARDYFGAKLFWQNQIAHTFNRSDLEGDGFAAQKIDLERKGFFELEDLVRFLNIESGTFFRNRDIYLIFKRLTKGNKASFDSLMDEICQQ